MKRIFAIVALFVLFGMTGTASAVPVTVDFSVLGINSVDITNSINPAGLTLNGATFRYDDFGSGVDFGIADAAGLFGTTGGSLIMEFSAPARQLGFDYSLLGLPAPVPNAIVLTVFNAGIDQGTLVQDALMNDVNGDAFARFFYNGLPFDRAQMFFDFNAPFFSVANIVYDTEAAPAPVPEPGLLAILASCLALFGCARLLPRKGA